MAMAGLFTPGAFLSCIIDIAISAPVFPHERAMFAFPVAREFSELHMLELLPDLIAEDGFSFIAITLSHGTMEHADNILSGRVRGRVVIDVNN